MRLAWHRNPKGPGLARPLMKSVHLPTTRGCFWLATLSQTCRAVALKRALHALDKAMGWASPVYCTHRRWCRGPGMCLLLSISMAAVMAVGDNATAAVGVDGMMGGAAIGNVLDSAVAID